MTSRSLFALCCVAWIAGPAFGQRKNKKGDDPPPPPSEDAPKKKKDKDRSRDRDAPPAPDPGKPGDASKTQPRCTITNVAGRAVAVDVPMQHVLPSMYEIECKRASFAVANTWAAANKVCNGHADPFNYTVTFGTKPIPLSQICRR